MKPNKDNLIWIDLEMTGLNPDKDRIIEIATVVTDTHLNVLAEGPELAVHQSDKVLVKMDKWCVHQHGLSGLTEKVKKSRISTAKAEKNTLEFLKEYVPEGISPMCGNTIGQDRRFLYRYMPELEKYFHYRHLDVSTLKILAKRWAPKIVAGMKKESGHRALEDVYDSIRELRYYREHFIKN